MAQEIHLPELGENIEQGDVVQVLVAAGDVIEAEQAILEVETDKAAIEVPSPAAGKVTAVHVNKGDVAKVGQLILSIEGSGASAQPSKAPASTNGSQKAPASKKSSTPNNSPSVNQAPAAPRPAAPTIAQTSIPSFALPAAPSIRRLARELGVDVTQILGTGPAGRIAPHDIRRGPAQAGANANTVFGIKAETLPDFSKWGGVEEEKFTNVRRATAQHLSFAWLTVPQVTHHDKVDITDLEKARKQAGSAAQAKGGKLTVTAILLHILAQALKEFPQFNASIDMMKQVIIKKSYVNIGVAVDTPRGLIVPVVRDVDQKSIVDLSVELTELSLRARDRKTSIEEMQGGNFTISNLGGIGGVGFSPIVNTPEVAILGVSRASVEPRYIGDKFEPRKIMPLSLFYDHRLIDGADAARFLRWVAEKLEDPKALQLDS